MSLWQVTPVAESPPPGVRAASAPRTRAQVAVLASAVVAQGLLLSNCTLSAKLFLSVSLAQSACFTCLSVTRPCVAVNNSLRYPDAQASTRLDLCSESPCHSPRPCDTYAPPLSLVTLAGFHAFKYYAPLWYSVSTTRVTLASIFHSLPSSSLPHPSSSFIPPTRR